MFPKLGMGELIIILLIVVVLFGASRLPQLGKGLGEGIRSFKKSFAGEDEEKPSSGAPSTTASTQPNDPSRKV
jgi:sec-independent protein translocase protein TatA